MTAPNTHSINPKAAAWTIGVHALLLLFFAFWRYSLPPAPAVVQEDGIEVNLGSSDDGLGAYQPQDPESPAAMASRMSSAAGGSAAMQDMMRDADDDNPEVNTAAHAAAPVHAAAAGSPSANMASQAQRNTVQQQQRPRYVYPGANGTGGSGAMALAPGGAEGNTHGTGDRGVPAGTPGAATYTGTPSHGTGGIAFSLAERNIVAYPPREAEFREGGKVIIRVTVNRAGAIVNSEIRSSTNGELNSIALRKLHNVRFNKSDDAPQEQFGTITFVFRAGQ